MINTRSINVEDSLILFSKHDGHSVVPLEEAYDGTMQGFTDDDGMGPVLPHTGMEIYS